MSFCFQFSHSCPAGPTLRCHQPSTVDLDPFDPAGTVVVDITQFSSSRSGNTISASAGYRAVTNSSRADVTYLLGIKESVGSMPGTILAAVTYLHSNSGSFVVPKDVTVTWSTSITAAAVQANTSYDVVADVTGIPLSGGVPSGAHDSTSL